MMHRFDEIIMTAQVLPLQFPIQKPRISVIMVSYMTGPALLEAITAVIDDSEIFELVIVDNGNTYAARQKLSDLVTEHDKIRMLQSHGNIGFAKGCNYGARMARGSHFLFLNPDAVIAPGTAMGLVEAGEKLDSPWIVGGRLKDVNGHEQRGSRRGELTPKSALISFTLLHKLPFFRSLHWETEPLPDEPIEVPVISGACLMMSRECFDMTGGFDEDYFLHVEDIELCHRVRRMGGKVLFHPHADVLHYGSTSAARRQDIEFSKFRGFYRYFRNYSNKPWAKVLTTLAAPFMFAAVMSRAWYLVLRRAFLGN